MSTGYRFRGQKEERPFRQEPDPPRFDTGIYDEEESTEVTRLHRSMREQLRSTDSRLSSLSEKIQELLDLASSEKAAGAT